MGARVAALALLLAVGAARSHAVETEELPGRLALCAGCHGEDGNSALEGVPSLAGQPVKFLEGQLRLFRGGLRASQAMAPLVQGVSDRDLGALASHYAALEPAAERAALDEALFAKGRAIAETRVCGSCHAADLHGGAEVPRLAGQREEYLSASLLAFRENRRPSSDRVMNAAMERVPDDQIRALAHYLAQCR
jgi:cytochrome c553